MKLLIIGAGGMGRRHANAFNSTGRCEVSTVDPNSEATFKSLAQAGTQWDAAVIATPAHLHLSHAKWCVEHSISFLLEKPIATREAGLPELIASVKKKKLIAGVAYPRRSSPAAQTMAQLLKSGKIGNLKMIHSTFSQDYRKYRPDYARIYYAKLATGGGFLMDGLSHHVNLVSYLAGPILSVHSLHRRLVFRNTEGEDSALLQLSFKNGVIGSVQGNQFQKPNVDSIELVGSKGNIRYERVSEILSVNTTDTVEWDNQTVSGNWDEIILTQAHEFLDAIKGKKKLRTSLEEGLETLRVIVAARKSQATGRTIHV